ncbi:uncharacterized protein J3R85_012083 [Psidium guajava]|nr:uncharacterized protein J3R85_012083 [Psidium guajava]
MGESIDVWREFFRTTAGTDVFEFIDKAIAIAALDRPKDFLSRRDRIAERLFSCEMIGAGGDCTTSSKESKADSNTGNVAREVVNVKYGPGEAETFSDDIEETSQEVGEVLRIKRVLDNSRHESDSALLESLRRLRSMTITMDILKKTKIGISVNSLQRNCKSKQIAQLAHNITMGWKALVEENCRGTEGAADPCDVGDGPTYSVKNQNIRKRGQEQYDIKFQATKRKMQELYQKAEADKRRRKMQVLDPRDLPKMAASLNASCTTAAKAHRRKVSSRSQVSCV